MLLCKLYIAWKVTYYQIVYILISIVISLITGWLTVWLAIVCIFSYTLGIRTPFWKKREIYVWILEENGLFWVSEKSCKYRFWMKLSSYYNYSSMFGRYFDKLTLQYEWVSILEDNEWLFAKIDWDLNNTQYFYANMLIIICVVVYYALWHAT